MRFFTSLAAVAICLLLSACGGDKPAKISAPTVAERPAAVDAIVVNHPATHLDACGERMKSFLRWYRESTNGEKPDATHGGSWFKLPVDAAKDPEYAAKVPPQERSSTKYVEVNWPNIEQYLRWLGKSGYFSESYLQTKRASMTRRGKALEVAKQEVEVFDGFEADEVFWTQELYEPPTVDHLQAYQEPGLAAGQTAYKLVLDGAPTDDEWAFLLYTKSEKGRCVIDSIAHLRGGRQHESLGNR
jgi:hypothetical protein